MLGIGMIMIFYLLNLLPAKSLGMWTVRILTGFGKHAGENDKLKSDWSITSLQELLTIFQK